MQDRNQHSSSQRKVVVALLAALALATTIWLFPGADAAATPMSPKQIEELEPASDTVAAQALQNTFARVELPDLDKPVQGPAVHRRGDAMSWIATVVDQDSGQPVAGARVEFFERPLLRDIWTQRDLFARAPLAIAQSEDDGSVWLPRSMHAVLHVDVHGPWFHSTAFVAVDLPRGDQQPAVLEAARGGRVRGRLVSQTLEPIRVARVLAVPEAAVMLDVMQGGHLTMRTAPVDADGSFVFAGLPAGRGCALWRLTAPLPRPAARRLPCLPGDDVSVDLLIGPSRLLTGLVRDARNRPVAGALVRYSKNAPGGLDGYDLLAKLTAPQEQTWTDDRGRFALAGVPRSKIQLFAAHPTQGASSPQKLDLRTAVLPAVMITLAGDVLLSGSVIDQSGAPIADATVTFLGSAGRPKPLPADRQTTARSHKDGAFALLGPLPTDGIQANILVEAAGFAGAVVRIEVPARDAALVLQRGRSLAGQVVAAATNAPVQAFAVQIESAGPERKLGRRARGETLLRFDDPDGRFTTGSDFDGLLQIRVSAEGYDTTSLTVDTADANDLRIELQPALSIEGTVVDAAGTPVADARVAAAGWAMTGISQLGSAAARATAVTDPSGRFVLADVRPNVDLYLHVAHDAFLPLQNHRVRATDDAYARQRLVLQRGGSIAGRVTTPSGAPCPAHDVVCLSTAGGGALHRVRADAAGNYRVDRLDPDLQYDLAVLAPGAALDMQELLAAVDATRVGVDADAVTQQDLVFAQAGSAIVSGVVTLADGSLFAGCSVLLLDAQDSGAFGLRGSRRTETGNDGRFELRDVATGAYVLAFGELLTDDRNAAMAGQQSLVVATNAAIELHLTMASGSLTGSVQEASGGAAVAGTRVVLEAVATAAATSTNSLARRLASRRTDTDGRFAFRAVGLGTYRVFVIPSPGSHLAGAVTGPLEISAAAPNPQVRVQLSRGVLVRMSVRDESGAVEGATLEWTRGSSAVLMLVDAAGNPLRTAADGIAATTRMQPGTYAVRARLGQRISDPQQVTVPATGMLQIDFRLAL